MRYLVAYKNPSATFVDRELPEGWEFSTSVNGLVAFGPITTDDGKKVVTAMLVLPTDSIIIIEAID